MTSQLDTERVIEALRAGRLELQPVTEGGQLKFWALVPSGQPQADTDGDRWPPTPGVDPRRTKPL